MNLEDKTVLVTGSSGYVASYLIPLLLQKKATVVGIDRLPNNQMHTIKTYEFDLIDNKQLEQVFYENKIDLIIHLAAAKGDWGISTDEYYHDNVLATRSVINGGKKFDVKRWIFYSTVAVLGPSNNAADEEEKYNPNHPYGETKKLMEQDIFEGFRHQQQENSIIIVRPSVVYGPNNPDSTNIYRLIDAIDKSRFIMIGNGKTIKSTSYIENICDATLFLTDKIMQVPGIHLFHYVDEPAMTNGFIVNEIYQLSGKKQSRISLPLFMASIIAVVTDFFALILKRDFPITAARIRKFCRSTDFSARKIRELGYKQLIDNKTALKRTVEWHLSKKNDLE